MNDTLPKWVNVVYPLLTKKVMDQHLMMELVHQRRKFMNFGMLIQTTHSYTKKTSVSIYRFGETVGSSLLFIHFEFGQKMS